MWKYNYTFPLTSIPENGTIISKSSELIHYGVKGMRWGVRKDYEMVGRKNIKNEKPKSKRHLELEEKYIFKGMNQEEAEKRAGRRVKVEKFLKVAAGITVAAAYIATQEHKVNSAYEHYETEILKHKGNGVAMNLSDIPIKRWENDNIDHDSTATNPQYDKIASKAYRMNCSNCTVAYEMRRRGFDVEAAPLSEGRNVDAWIDMFNGLTLKKARVEGTSKAEDIRKEASTWGDGARGVIAVQQGGLRLPGTAGGGHVFSIEVDNGNVRFIDAQDGSEYSDRIFSLYKRAYFGRVDNLDLTTNVRDTFVKANTSY